MRTILYLFHSVPWSYNKICDCFFSLRFGS